MTLPSRRFPLNLADGRVLDLDIRGSVAGDVLVFLHGTPGCAGPPRVVVDAATARGLGVVSWARPGYGGSTRQPGRTVAAVAADLVEVLNHLGLEQVFVVGWSGGGPHALACAALAPERVAAALVIAGVAPYDAGSQDRAWIDGMGADNIEEFEASVAGEDALRAYLEPQRSDLVSVTGPQLAQALGSLVCPADQAALQGTAGLELADDLAAQMSGALGPGVDGWVDDDLAFVRPWGCDLSRIAVPLQLWQGSDDLMVPAAHGGWLAERLGVPLQMLAGEGHISIVSGRIGEMLDGLLSSRLG